MRLEIEYQLTAKIYLSYISSTPHPFIYRFFFFEDLSKSLYQLCMPGPGVSSSHPCIWRRYEVGE